MKTNDTPRVYVCCLACYNDGTLHGEWIDATSADAIRELIGNLQGANEAVPDSIYPALRAGSNDPSVLPCGHIGNDWAIHDYDGLPSSLGENPDLDDLETLALALEEHGDAFRAYLDATSESFPDVSRFEERYCGQFDSECDYAYDYVEQTGLFDGAADTLTNYFDYESYARDLFLDGHSFVRVNGVGYVFYDN